MEAVCVHECVCVGGGEYVMSCHNIFIVRCDFPKTYLLPHDNRCNQQKGLVSQATPLKEEGPVIKEYGGCGWVITYYNMAIRYWSLN